MNILTFKTCVSDRHKLVGMMLRSTFTKGKPKKNISPLLQKLTKSWTEDKKRLSSVQDFESLHLKSKMALD